MSAKLQNSVQPWLDPDDAPEITDEWIAEADLYKGDGLVRRGRPKAASRKLALTVRYDADIITAFKASGAGWQTRMNDALREWLKTHAQAQ
jgi:uncharacterized protein (DUF4415 family)